jgi:YesN/AraC family two-component response regulator
VELKALIAGVVGLMQAEYAKDISLELCADRFGITPYALSKAFKQVMGENYIDHLTRIRLEKAKALLTNSDLKINDIAESVGYQGTYFNRIFKRAQGITPSQYRELHMKE